MKPIVIAQSRVKWIVFLVVALSFVAAGALLLAIGESPLKAWGTIVFFGGCALVFAWQIIDNRPRIIINNDGIVDRTLKVGVIEWSDIRAAWLYRKSGIPFVGLDLRDPAKYVARLSPLMQRMAALNESSSTHRSISTSLEPSRCRSRSKCSSSERSSNARAKSTRSSHVSSPSLVILKRDRCAHLAGPLHRRDRLIAGMPRVCPYAARIHGRTATDAGSALPGHSPLRGRVHASSSSHRRADGVRAITCASRHRRRAARRAADSSGRRHTTRPRRA